MRTSIYLILFVWLVVGCESFLEEKIQNEIHPKTVSDMEKLLEGEAYYTSNEGHLFSRVTDIFTDDIACNVVTKTYLEEKQRDRYRFLWQENMFDDNGWGYDIAIWQVPYSRIKGCNVILEYMDQMDGDEVKQEHLRGEAYFLRGFYYFYLTNFFGFPYNYGNPAENPAVPLKLVSGVTDEKFERNSVAECYAQIEKDLLKGVELMRVNKERQSSQSFRVNYLTGYGMLSRMYLYMEDWDKAILYADSVLEVKSSLLRFEEKKSSSIYTMAGNIETLWVMGEKKVNGSYGERCPYAISEDLVRLYTRDKTDGEVDWRDGGNGCNIAYLAWGFKYAMGDEGDYLYYGYERYGVSKTGSGSGNTWYTGGIRIAELYLNRAEAYIRKYMEDGNQEYARQALSDFKTLRQSRFSASGFQEKNLEDFEGDQQALLDFCLRERRRELCGEGNHRWFDLKRIGMPEIKHVYMDDDNGRGQEYVLEQGDARYVLPIPEEVRLQNPNLNKK